jgi:hypothetical protein
MSQRASAVTPSVTTLEANRTPDRSLVVYTAISRDYDDLQEPPATAASGADFVAFLEAPAASATWRWRPLHAGLGDACRDAKIHKVLSHVYFPDAVCSLWIDGSVAVRSSDPISALADAWLADYDLVVFPHRLRTCIYQEAAVCLQRGLDDAATILRQVGRYTHEGYPANAGLVECPVVLRRHTQAVKDFNEAWWREIVAGSKRDQLSFQYAARAVGLRYGTFPDAIDRSPHFLRRPHSVARGRPMTGREPAASPAPATTPRPPSPARRGARRTIAFGPVRARPSWDWVGFDTARQLSSRYNVVVFPSSRAIPDCDAAFMIKTRPPDEVVSEARSRGVELVYCPIDRYRDADEISRDREFLGACSMVLTHCEWLLPILEPFCGSVHFVDHHARHALTVMAPYKERGYVLWIGACQNLPFLLKWLEAHPLDLELRILTDLDHGLARDAALAAAEEIGLAFDIDPGATSIAGHRVYRWSERRQEEMMRECKAALDVKLTTVFNQLYKPSAKAQQFVGSGVPLAMNPDSYSAGYFRARGFELASPLDPARWLSREYWEATRRAGDALRAATALAVIGARYEELIESLWLPGRLARSPAWSASQRGDDGCA